jgi:hypothetical protein
MKRPLQRAPHVPALALALSLVLASRSGRAEPPMMKEHSVKPRIEARSDDGRYSVSLGGFIQGRYTLALRDSALATSRFDTPRTRLYVFGHVHSKDVRYRLMVGTPPSSLGVELYDAYVDWRASDALHLRGGHFKIPVYREWIESARLLASVERSILTQMLSPGRDWGAMVAGELFSSHIDYAVGLFNGGKAANDEGPLIAARVAWNALGRSIEGEIDFENSQRAVVIGLSGYTSFEAPRLRDSAGGVEVAYRERGLDVTVEVMGRERKTTEGGAALTAGLYARADKYVPSLRASFGGRATRVIGLDEPISRTELDFDAAYYPAEHDLKVATNVGLAHLHDEDAWEPFLMIQVQAGF